MYFFASIAFSELSKDLSVEGESSLRAQKDLRITGIKISSMDNGISEKSNYNVNSTSVSAYFSEANTSITYQVTITNKTSMMFVYSKLEEITYDNSNVTYSISGINIGDTYGGESVTFNLTLTSKVSNQNVNLNLEYTFEPKNVSWDFTYHVKEEVFKIPYSGVYKLEVWGASGGDTKDDNRGGYGGYSVGNISLTAGTDIYINVGGAGTVPTTAKVIDGGYNGGGSGSARDNGSKGLYVWGGSGGGATHVALTSGLLSSLSSKYKNNLLIVAGGGGGGETYTPTEMHNYSGNGGSGGGFTGGSGVPDNSTVYGYGTGGTQTTGGSQTVILSSNGSSNGTFGKGATVVTWTGAGGGGGFFGGGTIEHGPAGGGSGYINYSGLSQGAMYCYDCTEEFNVSSSFTVSTTGSSSYRDTVNCSNGFSTDAVSKCAKKGNGLFRLTVVSFN